jgi:CspA family cold shock protein
VQRSKDYRPRQRRSWNDDDGSHFGVSPTLPLLPSFSLVQKAPEEVATVKWYSPEKGFGFVTLANGSGDAFLHTKTVRASGHQAVAPGAILLVRVSKAQKGLQVDEVLSVTEVSGGVAPSRSGTSGRPHRFEHRRREVDTSELSEVSGVVKWYSPSKGYGFVTSDVGGKDVFVHASVVAQAGIAALNEGQAVTMGIVSGSKGPEAATISLA